MSTEVSSHTAAALKKFCNSRLKYTKNTVFKVVLWLTSEQWQFALHRKWEYITIARERGFCCTANSSAIKTINLTMTIVDWWHFHFSDSGVWSRTPSHGDQYSVNNPIKASTACTLAIQWLKQEAQPLTVPTFRSFGVLAVLIIKKIFSILNMHYSIWVLNWIRNFLIFAHLYIVTTLS